LEIFLQGWEGKSGYEAKGCAYDSNRSIWELYTVISRLSSQCYEVANHKDYLVHPT